MAAKESLLSTLSILKSCLNEQSLIDKAPSETEHNQRAGMLRQGLAVLNFSAVETFIRDRTNEVLQDFINTGLSFSNLSSNIQDALTLGALEGIKFRLKQQTQNQQLKILWVVNELEPIANAHKNLSQVSKYAFGHNKSNIAEEDIAAILKAFGVDSPWKQMTDLTSRIGTALLDARGEFSAIRERRHASAHALSTNVTHSDLLNSANSSLAICITFDLLLTHAGNLFRHGLGPGQVGNRKLEQDDLSLLFNRVRSARLGVYEVKKEQPKPPARPAKRTTLRLFNNLIDAQNFSHSYAQARSLHLITLDATSTPIDWTSW
jgi:hypothetical protein